eukprot:TRINITY_DN14396_c0_g2_i1.p1 TRINITY_DN14396_c0_g2~~TRINITY_DN14396_c0_g2_i1.p1  ORF type:complete len:728 (-),score=163.12 TRINITY_DN14396_c0_g2_i1:66-2249(-)
MSSKGRQHRHAQKQNDLRLRDANDNSEEEEGGFVDVPPPQQARGRLRHDRKAPYVSEPDDAATDDDGEGGSPVFNVIDIDSSAETFEKLRKPAKEPHIAFEVLDEIAEERRLEREREEEKAAMHNAVTSRSQSLRKVNTKLLGFDPAVLSPAAKLVHYILQRWEFDLVIGVVILANGGVIGLESSYKSQVPLRCSSKCVCLDREDPGISCKTLPDWVNALDWCFLGIYTLEVSLRFWVAGFCVALRSNWVKFDFFLVLSSYVYKILELSEIDLESLSLLMLVRMLRLARLARAVRLLVTFRTLWKLVQGLFSCLYTLFWTLILVLVLFYMFALIGMELIKVDMDLPLTHPYNIAAKDNFRDLLDTMLMLLQLFSWDSIAAVYRPLIIHRGPLVFFYFVLVLLVMAIALVNLVTALMVESALAIAEEDKDAKKAWEAARKQKQMEQLKIMFQDLDEDGSGELSMDEIDGAPAEIRDQLIDIAGTEDIQSLFEVLDYDGGGTVGTDEFCEGVFRFKTSDKPMELGKLAKQCAEILLNAREIYAVLSNDDEKLSEVKERRSTMHSVRSTRCEVRDIDDDDSSGSEKNQSKPESGDPLRSTAGTFASDDDSDIQESDVKNADAEENAGSMSALEARIDGLEDMAETMQDSLRQAFEALERLPRTKRAVAVARGHSHSKSKMMPLANNHTLTLPGATAMDPDSEHELRRRVEMLEAQLRAMSKGSSGKPGIW